MKTDPCQFNRERLVDYADGMLSPEQAKEVTDHVQACPACEQWVGALKQSLAISQGLWHTGYEQVQSVSMPVHTRKYPKIVRKVIAVAACMGLAGAVWLMVHRPQAQSNPTIAQITQDIQDAQHVASQLMVAQILASCDGTEDILRRHYQYIEDTYPDTYHVLKHKSEDTSIKERDL
jgi:hypothetical protein